MIMNKIAPYLFAPTGLWVFWLVTYIDYIVDSQHSDWFDFPFFMTLFIIEIVAISISMHSFRVLVKRRKEARNETI